MRSRRLKVELNPNMAEAATPATDVPKARLKPLIGAAKPSRMACSSVLPSRANTAPCKVSTMPTKVPSKPSITSRPTKYGVSTGAGRATRSLSIRRRTEFCNETSSLPSQVPSSVISSRNSSNALLSESVAWRYLLSSTKPMP